MLLSHNEITAPCVSVDCCTIYQSENSRGIRKRGVLGDTDDL